MMQKNFGNIQIGRGIGKVHNGSNVSIDMEGDGNVTNIGSITLKIVKGKKSRIHTLNGVHHCIADENGGEFHINTSTIKIDANGEWDVYLSTAGNMDTVYNISLYGERFCFSKDGTSPLNRVIRRLGGSMNQIL